MWPPTFRHNFWFVLLPQLLLVSLPLRTFNYAMPNRSRQHVSSVNGRCTYERCARELAQLHGVIASSSYSSHIRSCAQKHCSMSNRRFSYLKRRRRLHRNPCIRINCVKGMIKSSSEFWSLKSCARRSWPCWMMINGAIGVDRRPQQTAQSTSYNPYSGKRPINAINSNYLNRHPNFSRRPPYAYPSFDSSSSSSLYPQIFGPIPVPIQSMVPSSPILIQPPLADQQTVEMPPTGMWDDPHSQYHHAHHYPPTHVNVILDQHPAHMHPTVPMEAPPY